MVYTKKIFRLVAFTAATTVVAASQATSFAVLFDGRNSEQVEGCEFSTSSDLYEKTQNNFRLYGPGQAHWGNAKLIWSPKSNIFDEDINNLLSGKSARKNLTINLREHQRDRRYRLQDSWITSLGFPECNRTKNASAGLEITYTTAAPIAIKENKAQGVMGQKAKSWMVNNFQFNIDGLGQACGRVTKVDAFTIKQGITDSDGDGAPDYMISDLTFELPQAAAQAMGSWYFGGSEPRNGYIDYLDNKGGIMHRLAFQIAPIAIGDLDGDGLVTVKCSHVGPVRWMAPESIR